LNYIACAQFQAITKDVVAMDEDIRKTLQALYSMPVEKLPTKEDGDDPNLSEKPSKMSSVREDIVRQLSFLTPTLPTTQFVDGQDSKTQEEGFDPLSVAREMWPRTGTTDPTNQSSTMTKDS
jgi:hypothetical protein